jgi:hypothetical protein
VRRRSCLRPMEANCARCCWWEFGDASTVPARVEIAGHLRSIDAPWTAAHRPMSRRAPGPSLVMAEVRIPAAEDWSGHAPHRRHGLPFRRCSTGPCGGLGGGVTLENGDEPAIQSAISTGSRYKQADGSPREITRPRWLIWGTGTTSSLVSRHPDTHLCYHFRPGYS